MFEIIVLIIYLYILIRSFKIYFEIKKLRERCQIPLDVECVDVKTTTDNHNQLLYLPVWDGFYQNVKHTYSGEQYVSQKYELGQTETIFINQQDPTEYVDSLKLNKQKGILIKLKKMLIFLPILLLIVLNESYVLNYFFSKFLNSHQMELLERFLFCQTFYHPI